MHLLAVIVALTAISISEQAHRPACNAATQGRLWPAEANVSTNAARQLFQAGELEICSQALWKYKWVPLSVNVRKAASRKQASH